MTASNLVSGDGPSPCDWLFLGEAPGAMEDKYGIPFIGPAGDVLWELASHAGLVRTMVHVDNIYPYRPPNNRTPTKQEIASQAERLQNLLATVNPRYVVLLGATAISAMLPGMKLKDIHGIPHRLSHPPDRHRTGNPYYIPMYHPAASLHNPLLMATMEHDWKELPNRILGFQTPDSGLPQFTEDDHTMTIVNDTVLALDTETNPDGSLLCFSTCSQNLDGALRTTVYTGRDGKPTVTRIFCNTLVMHHAKFDLQVLRRAGIVITYRHLKDTMLTAWVIGEESLGLKALATRYCNLPMVPLRELLANVQRAWNSAWLFHAMGINRNKTEDKQWARWRNDSLSINPVTKLYKRMVELFGPPPVAEVKDLPGLTSYAALDAVATLRLHQTQQPRLTAEMSTILAIEEGCVPILADMEYRGVMVDYMWLSKHSDALFKQEHMARSALPSGLNPASGQQLAEWLYKDHNPKFWTKTLKPATHKQALTELGTSEAKAVLHWRHITDQLEVVVGLLDDCVGTKDSRVHTQFQQVRTRESDGEDGEGATATGRLSSRDPNLQNIAPELRRAFIAAPGHKLVSVDYSQIEPRLMAYYAQDTVMADGFRNGISPYITVGNQVWKTEISRDSEHYKLAKILVLGTNYRLTDYGFAQRSGLSIDEAGRIIRTYMESFPGIQTYMDDCLHQLKTVGYVQTYHGRRRYLEPDERGWRQAVNMPIQGTAAEIIKIAMAKVADYYPILQVHDELVAEVPEHLTERIASAIIKAMIEAWPTQIGDFVPCEAHATVGDNWLDMKPLEVPTCVTGT